MILIKVLNKAVNLVEQLPFSLANNININVSESIILYLIIILFTLYLALKSSRWLKLFLIGLIIFLIVDIVKYSEIHHQKRFIVFHTQQNTALSMINGKKALLLHSFPDTAKICFQTGNYIIKRGIGGRTLKLNDKDFTVFEIEGFYCEEYLGNVFLA
ncbi:MAG: hypothetical protein HC906_16960 [Bacteroidales bacterium]|nr:hypothetical protein [Bacteroidales bacterium]